MIKELLEDIKNYRNDMVAKNYPHQRISDIIIKWEDKIMEKDKKAKESKPAGCPHN